MGYHGGNNLISALAVRFIAALTVIAAIMIGVGLGLSLAMTKNIKNQENFVEFAPALPTRVLDINGTLITEFASDEKRELVALSDLPRHLIHAVLSREDPNFYNHKGFSIRGTTRAFVGLITRKNLGGGSTITQQVAGTLYTDRSEKTFKRKIRELWWAFQIERRYTKNEILEIYLNYMPMGPGTYGVETTSKYYFNHSAKDVNIAEAAALAVMLSGPTRFNPINNPNEAMSRQHYVLERMIQFGYAEKDEAETSFSDFWDSFDYTKTSVSAYYNREDKAPWFSEYVRRELDAIMYGQRDYYRDGYTVHTTLDLNHQVTAEKLMAAGLEKANRDFLRSSGTRITQAERTYIPIVELLTLYFDITDIRYTAAGQNELKAVSRYNKVINPVVDMAALVFGVPELKDITGQGFAQQRLNNERNVVEGALISIENETGYITAIVGGSKYDETNQLIRATQANIQPGSSFKPLYYSAAIDSRKFTASTLIYDIPIVFHNEDGTPYMPLNFRGEWKGSTLLYNALAQSMNVPSLKILDAIGFDAAIDRAAALLDITDSAQIRRVFPRVYPLGLGINTTSPLRMARAYAVFANQGRAVTPIAIRSIEDRNGRLVFDVERDTRQRQRRTGSDQIVSPQNAYIMTRIMEKVVDEGSLSIGAGYGSKFLYKDAQGTYRLPVAGKTGTTQNWSDAWAIGFSPYYTTAVWFGFDRPGNTLGVDQTGATLSGPVWGDFFREIHKGLPRKEFVRPATGIIDVSVCAKSGLLRNSSCNEGEVTLPFLEGTQPSQICDLHGGGVSSYRQSATTLFGNPSLDNAFLNSLQMPTLPLDTLPELRNTLQQQQPSNSTSANRGRTATGGRAPVNNPYLDDSPPPNNPAVFPDNVIQYVPDDENSYYPESDLPPWNPLF